MDDRKFQPGERIETLADLDGHLKRGRWVYLHDTPKHPKVLMNMTLHTLQQLLDGRDGLRLAEPNKETENV